MSDRIKQLSLAWHRKNIVKDSSGEEMIEVSVPASTAASLYEKVRMAVDYQEEHLLRRNAVLRIIKRLLGSDVPIEKMAYQLLKELIWAKYLPNKEVPINFVEKLIPIFLKYEPVLRAVDESYAQKDELFFWVLDVLSTEVEYALTPPVKEEALVSYMYEEMRDRIFWDPKIEISDDQKDLLLYIAIHQKLLKSNIATLRFRVMTLYYPDWPGASDEHRIKEVADEIETIVTTIERNIMDPLTAKIGVQIRRRVGVFRTIGDLIESNGDEIDELLSDPAEFDKALTKSLKKRTKEFRVRLRRIVVRAVVFLFLTKMLLALVMEVPYDFLVLHELNLFPLGVNIFFPPILLALIGLTVGIPERKNASDYTDASRALLVGADHDLLNMRMKAEGFSRVRQVFNTLYSVLFLAIYGFIALGLTQIGFNWLSILLFLFFLSLVTFFGIRIRASVKEIILSPSRAGLIGSLFDVLMLPIVRAGRWLSVRVAKINVFIYFFDFIIEAPLKVAIRFLEGWIKYIREKKEEI